MLHDRDGDEEAENVDQILSQKCHYSPYKKDFCLYLLFHTYMKTRLAELRLYFSSLLGRRNSGT